MESKLNKFSAIETLYQGYEFRSRLEAKWAVFFDLCGWRWGYEPPEMGGWLPDFVLGESATLVEVKPFYCQDDWGDVAEKVVRSGCRSDVVLLGADPSLLSDNQPQRIGWILQQDGDLAVIHDLHFGFTHGNGKPGLCPMDSAWRNIAWNAPAGTKKPNKWSRVGDTGGRSARDTMLKSWAVATNNTKWLRKPNATSGGRQETQTWVL